MQDNNPEKIESKSMKIIEKELNQLKGSEREKQVIKRVIHATADLNLVDKVKLSPDGINQLRSLIESGADIITDVNMLKAGINTNKLKEYGGQLKCYIADQQIREEAKKTGLTRSIMSMRKAVKEPGKKVFAIGNAPTALFELIRLNQEENIQIDFIVGTPVGFVGAAESKDKLIASDIPHISLQGRKGGSAVAASIINSILYM
ncbi:precorrin-8X methylmutase [Halanaerobiaceae bacterium Z-7014]|uniref:Precorrin-8X methylmutase n=1 Tax=Halonatronomonas betaini TaxID=2778430 RepID=A0A931F727_9FIRM|nr:precorrin-8X methylmutase [Halonatronomonas betaini]MBF8436181.1 precorrin-8X methylmutase [Halonatronomonas betaini]